MKFPSVQYLFKQASGAFSRFPFTIAAAILAAVTGIIIVEWEDSYTNIFPIANLLLCGYLGVPLFISARIWGESKGWEKAKILPLKVFVVALLVAVYFYLPGSQETLNKLVPYVRYVVFAIAAHLLVSFIPFIGGRQINGFWQYNKTLFLRFLLSALYSGFFYVGIVLALGALNVLFEADIDEKVFFEVFIVVAAVFNTWFFVAGLPADTNSLETDQVYPNGLRVFILYVLIPLLGLYIIILYSYSAKVVLSWDWPQGIIAYMIIAVAVLGILAMLLSWPFAQGESAGPLKFLSRSYYFLLVPLAAMLFLAIWLRTADYGITVNRYVTWLMGIWLVAICGYFIFRGKDLRVVPLSLFAFTLFSSFGPWGMFSVSERSQVYRLEKLLTENGILVNGKIANEPTWDESDTTAFTLLTPRLNETKISHDDHNEVESIVNYLQEFHGLSSLDDWYGTNPLEIAKKTKAGEASVYMQLMGLDYIHYYDGDGYRYMSFYANASSTVREVKGYDYLLTVSYYQGNEVPIETINSSEGSVSVVWSDSTVTITQVQKDTTIAESIDVKDLFDSLQVRYPSESGTTVADDEMTLMKENDWVRLKLSVKSLSGQVNGHKSEITGYDGELLLGLKDSKEN